MKVLSRFTSKENYLQFYFKFLILEIPNIIQIIGFITFFALFSSNVWFKYLSTLIVMCLLNFYLIEKFHVYVKSELIEAAISAKKIDIKKLLKKTLLYRQIAIIGTAIIQILMFRFINLKF